MSFRLRPPDLTALCQEWSPAQHHFRWLTQPIAQPDPHLACEDWSFIAEWTGFLCPRRGRAPKIVYSRFLHWWDSVDMADALHPQTLITYGMNGADLPVGHGGPIRVRVPRQLGYKSIKHVSRLLVTDSLKEYWPESSYSWYAGI